MTDANAPERQEDGSSDLSNAAPLSLRKAFGLGFAVLGLGTGMLGSPAGTLIAGNGAWLVYLVSIGLMLALVVSISEFARRYLVTGSLMSYLGDAFGQGPRAISGASLIFGYLLFCIAANFYLLAFAQSLAQDLGMDWLSGPTGGVLLCVLTPITAAMITFRGADRSAIAAIILTVISLPLVLILFGAVVATNGVSLHDQMTIKGGTSLGAIIAGIAFFSGNYLGFEGFTALASETANPRRNVPMILLGLLAAVAISYFVATIVATPVLLTHMASLTANKSPVAILAETGGVTWIEIPLNAALVLCQIASYVSLMNDASRVIATAGRDGMLPGFLGSVKHATGVPGRALWLILAITVFASVIIQVAAPAAPLMTMIALTPAVFFLWMIPYFGMCVGLVIICAREKKLKSPEAMLGIAGAALIGFIYFYQLTHPSSDVERVASRVALTAFGLLCLVTYFRFRRRRAALRFETFSQ